MRKRCLGLLLLLSFALLVTELSAEEETFTITTYYPSPYGSYNQLSVYRSVTYKPVNKDTITDPTEGELVYNNADDTLYLYNGSKWVGQGAQGGYFLQCGNTCPSGTTKVSSAAYGTGIGGVAASGGYSSYSCQNIDYYVANCICYCAPHLMVGGQVLNCGSSWECFRTIIYGADAVNRCAQPGNCEAFCKNTVSVKTLGAEISICK